ncbi:MAG: nucleotidyltransferase [Chloroflexi bacterium]|nr:nucleotidyltransferase [Chloroflexota bacterium]
MEGMIRAAAETLRISRVRYVIIGGIAASIWGRPRMTLDADIVIVVPLETLADLLDSLGKRGFQVTPNTLKKLKAMLPSKLRYEKRLSVDLRVASYSLDKKAIERAVTVTIFDNRLPVASTEDTVVYKLARFNDLDRSDIKAMIVRQKKRLDVEYLTRTCRELAEETGDARIVENLDVFLSWL